MKFKTILKTLPLAIGLGVCSTANAGVVATSYLELNNLFVEISTDGDTSNGGEVLPANIGQFIQILASTRETNSNVNFNGATDGSNNSTTTAGAASNANLVCTGPSCGGFVVGENGYSLDAGNLISSDALDYAISDVNLSGSALGGGASGFTYGDVGIAGGNNVVASASSNIFNNVLTRITITVGTDIAIRFSALYDLFVDAIISADIAADSSRSATASANANFSIVATSIDTGNIVLDDGISASRLVFDAPGLNDFGQFQANDQSFLSNWANVTAGNYQLTITQSSNVQASLIPEPGAIVLFGMGLLGLGLRARAKATK